MFLLQQRAHCAIDTFLDGKNLFLLSKPKPNMSISVKNQSALLRLVSGFEFRKYHNPIGGREKKFRTGNKWTLHLYKDETNLIYHLYQLKLIFGAGIEYCEGSYLRRRFDGELRRNRQ